MIKIKKPPGLIRYSSHNAIVAGKQKLFTPRVAGYSLVLTALVVFLSFVIYTRADIETTLLKTPGTLYTKTEDGQITNLYKMEIVNKTFDIIQLELKLESPPGATFMKVGSPDVVVPKEGILEGLIMVKMPEHTITTLRTEIEFGVYQDGEKVETVKAKFIGPIPSKKSKSL